MKTKSVILSVALSMVCLAASNAEACTTTIVTKGASADGSAYVTHSNDSFSSDPSIVYVPAKDHPAGAMRKVYPSAIAWDDLPEYELCVSGKEADKTTGRDSPGCTYLCLYRQRLRRDERTRPDAGGMHEQFPPPGISGTERRPHGTGGGSAHGRPD